MKKVTPLENLGGGLPRLKGLRAGGREGTMFSRVSLVCWRNGDGVNELAVEAWGGGMVLLGGREGDWSELVFAGLWVWAPGIAAYRA